MQTLDYLPALLAFVFALLAAFSKTRREEKRGILSITLAGWSFILLSAISLVYGVIVVNQIHDTQAKQEIIADIARRWTMDGLTFLLFPLCGKDEVSSDVDISTTFKMLRSKENLSLAGKKRTVNWPGLDGGTIFPFRTSIPRKGFKQPYQLYDYYIAQGESYILRALNTFGMYLSEEEIIAISVVLSDGFLNGRYKLSAHSNLFDQGLHDERSTLETSPWNIVGLYYFNAIYDGPNAREGNLQPAMDLLNKAERVAILLLRGDESLSFEPCT